MATLIVGDGSHSYDIQDCLYATGEDFTVVKEHTEAVISPGMRVIIAINNPQIRTLVAEKLQVVDQAWVHPSALTGPDCHWAFGTHINYGVTMTRTMLGHHVTVSPGVTICGDVVIGDRCLIGAGAVICDRVTIGNDVTIGAGCIVLPESVIEDGATYVGNPARRTK